MSDQKNKITWQCYPSDVEAFGEVNFPVVNDVINSRQNYFEEINKIDNLPNYKIPDSTGPINDFQGPQNNEPVRRVLNPSIAPIIVMTEVEPGMIVPGNISITLPNNPDLLYPNEGKENNKNLTHSYYGNDILNNNDLIIDKNVKDIAELHNPIPVYVDNEPNFYLAQPNVDVNIDVKNNHPVVNNQVDDVYHPENKHIHDNSPVEVVHKKMLNKKHNKLIYKILMYVLIALIIYLVYLLLFGKK